MSFANLKKNRKNKLAKLVEAAETETKNKSYGDDRIWKPGKDKAGNGYAIIRFLPTQNDETPWAKYLDHGFQGPTGRWYIEKSRRTLGEADPVAELNSELWNSTNIDDSPERNQARKQKARKNFVSNVYIVKDGSNSDNEGKVMIYKYGATIFNMLMDAMQPQFEDEDPIDPFDLWEGANFRIKIRKGENGWPTYDKSDFAEPAPLFDNDDELEEVYNKVYDIQEFIDPKSFKSYDELKAKLYAVLNMTQGEKVPTPKEEDQLGNSEEPKTMKEETQSLKSVETDDDDDDDSMSFFNKLAEED